MLYFANGHALTSNSGKTAGTEREMDDQPSTSVSLIRLAKRGDAEALNELFKRYWPRVLQIVRMRLGPGLRANLESRDIAQDAFIRALKGFEGFELRDEAAFLHWLGELVRNSIRDRHDYFGAKKRRTSFNEPLARCGEDSRDGEVELAEAGPTPSRWLAMTEELERLVAAVHRLPADGREAVIQRDMEGLPFAQIGRNLGRSEDAARMLYARAKSRLTTMLGEDRK